MRDAYQERLVDLADGLADMCEQVAQAMARGTQALLEVDLQLAEQVISDDAKSRRHQRRVPQETHVSNPAP